MYSSDFGIVSDGQLHNMRQELIRRGERDDDMREYAPPPPPPRGCDDKGNGILGSILSGIGTDDLILIAIGVLLLLDGKGDNDLLAIALLVLCLL